MTSSFDRRFSLAGLGRLLSHHGEAIAYTPAGGAAANLTAIVGQEETEEVEDDHGRYILRRRRITFTTDSTNTQFGGVDDVQHNATIAAAGETWSIERIGQKLAGFIEVVAFIREQRERTRPHYRR